MFDTSEKTIQSGTLTTVNQKWADLLTDTGILCRLRGATVSHLPPPPPGTQSSTTTSPTALLCSGAGDKSSPWIQKAALEAHDLHQLSDFSYHCTRSSAQSHQGHLSRYQDPLQITTELQKGVSLVSDQSTINPLSCMLPFVCFHAHLPAEKMALSQSAPIELSCSQARNISD